MRAMRTAFVVASLAFVGVAPGAAGTAFVGRFPNGVERPWAGPAYWTNPMEDWRVAGGRLEVVRGGANRNVHVLTRHVGAQAGTLTMSVRIGRADDGTAPGSAGFRIGIRSELGDYRSALFHGRGVDAGIAQGGGLFIRNLADAKPNAAVAQAEVVELRLTARPDGARYVVTLTAVDPANGRTLSQIEQRLPADRLTGNLALVNNYAARGRSRAAAATRARHWFDDWRISGSKVVAHDEQGFGPILFAQYTLSRRVLKMTAQMPPLGTSDARTVALQTQQNGAWQSIGRARIDALSRTATFRIAGWDASRDTAYRLVYAFKGEDGVTRDHHWTGTVRREPTKDVLVVAGFTGNTDPAFPNALLARNVGIHNPDLLFFSGDQIYEGVGGYGIHRLPVDVAVLNYLRKFYMWGWAFRDVLRDRPSLCLPDDHDVYQGNIWGNGGNPIAMRDHDAGGYVMHRDFVNAVQRTQTSHHPDPFDPTPIRQGITVYYGDMLYGRVSFAVLEDRKFKSGPKGTVATWPGRPDHVTDPNLDPKSLDKPGLTLLGRRQLRFLNHWAADWTGADLKAVLSQTIFCNLANYHGGNKMFLVADLDSNGWPQAGRNRALHAIRRGFAFMYAGDQHLPSIVQHGIDDYNDAGYSFCVPSTAAGYPRSWRPDQEGRPVRNRAAAGGPNTGEYLDGLGNRLTVHAIGNPAATNRPGVLNRLHDKSSGYGIVRFNTRTRDITMECWRLQIDAANPKPGDQFPGWPKTINLRDNYGRKAHAHLPAIEVTGMNNPVVQVIDEADGSIVYTLRITGTSFRPKVFKDGTYTIKVGEPAENKVKTFTGIKSGADEAIQVTF